MDLLEPSWWRMFVFNPLKEAKILTHELLLKLPYKKIFDEWFDWKESKELESAIYWYDTEIDKIKQETGSTKTKEIGGKTYTFEPRNQEFHENIMMKEKFGE